MENEAKKPTVLPPPDQLNKAMTAIAARSQRIVTDFLDRQRQDQSISNVFDPLHIGDAFLQMTAQMLAGPVTLAEAHLSLWTDYLQMWQNTAQRLMGGTAPPPTEAPLVSADGQKGGAFDFIAQSYLLTARWIQSLVGNAEGLDAETIHKVDFYTRQFIDAMSPVTLFESNPDLLNLILASNGELLVKGLGHLLGDLEHSKSLFSAPFRTQKAHMPGEQIAVTPGSVIFRNKVMELLHYSPLKAADQRTPLLIVPSWTEKYYLLDLRPDSSLIRWLVEQGFSVFLLSWSGADFDFAETVEQGLLAALAAIEQTTGAAQVNGVGVGLGGTLLAATQAWLAARQQDRFSSATFLASLLDFSQVGVLSVFIDEELLRRESDEDSNSAGQLPAMLSLLRANDLIWSFVLDTYQRGRGPFPFDLLAWNADVPHLPAKLQSFYLRELYQKNRLAEPGGLSLQGTPLDLGKITTPAYVLAMVEDHLVPWRSAFAATRLLGGPVRFVLAESGHAAGIVNPPVLGLHSHWVPGRAAKDADRWLKAAHRQPGSWWEDWGRWLAKQSGPTVLRAPADRTAALEDAPGSYVRSRE